MVTRWYGEDLYIELTEEENQRLEQIKAEKFHRGKDGNRDRIGKKPRDFADYLSDILRLGRRGHSPKEIAEALELAEVRVRDVLQADRKVRRELDNEKAYRRAVDPWIGSAERNGPRSKGS